MNKKEFIILIIIAGFLLGSLSAIGHKTVNYFWPDKPLKVEYKICD